MGTKNTRENLLQVATNLFSKKGYSGTAIREIGAKAGISNSIIYHYFKDKEHMLFEIIDVTSKDLIRCLIDIENRVSDPEECLKEMLKAHTVLFSLKKESKLLVVDLYWLKGKHQEIIRQHQRQIFDIYMKKLKELSAKGLLGEIDLTVSNFNIFAIINWFFRWYTEGGRLSKEEVAENIIKFVFHGIFKSRSRQFKLR